MVAGEQAQTAGVDRDAVVDAELGREVRDSRFGLLCVPFLEPRRGFEVMVEGRRDAVHVGEKPVVVHELLEPRLVGGAEQPDGAVVEGLEEVRVDTTEERDRVRVPAPPQVVRECLEWAEPVGQARQDGERADGTAGHAGILCQR